MAAPEIPKTMSGILISKTGGVEVLQYKTDLAVPELQEGEVLVRTEYIGVNYIDTYFRTGLYSAALPLITGKEAAGTVVSAHPSVSDRLPVGTRVACIADHTYAEYVAVRAAVATPLPDALSTKTAAAALLQGLTALTFVREAAGLTKPSLGLSEGPWALVHAAAGGTGSMLVQMLSTMGARVIGTAGGPEKCEIAKQNGAQWVVDSLNTKPGEDVVSRVREITGGHGVDVIFDGVGKATFDGDLKMIARKGTLAVFGNASGAPGPVELPTLSPKNIKLMRPALFGYIATPEERERYTKELFDLLVVGKIQVKIHEVYPLTEVARAHSDLEGRKTTGKLLLKV
ncbi:hypothetical protein MFIFM68171_06786 [Madurella fahalii]|uniref:Enoyl reductase (ER) domain-containing protein n=1 Tax=Madurella fahalii TaxID=1157608 RepID=A0ABQ0GFN1_9PEZI